MKSVITRSRSATALSSASQSEQLCWKAKTLTKFCSQSSCKSSLLYENRSLSVLTMKPATSVSAYTRAQYSRSASKLIR